MGGGVCVADSCDLRDCFCLFLDESFGGSVSLCDGIALTPCQVSQHLLPIGRPTSRATRELAAGCCASPPTYLSFACLGLVLNFPGQIDYMTEMSQRGRGIPVPCTCLVLGVRHVYPWLPEKESPQRGGVCESSILHPWKHFSPSTH